MLLKTIKFFSVLGLKLTSARVERDGGTKSCKEAKNRLKSKLEIPPIKI